MLSDEEKKAIEKIRSFNQYNWEINNLKEKEFAKPYFDALDTILNLIEKQSKEIEELKEVKWYYEISRVPKDKIKAKIEEYEEKIKKIKEKGVWEEPYDSEKYVRYTNYIYVLQSLLEKE